MSESNPQRFTEATKASSHTPDEIAFARANTDEALAKKEKRLAKIDRQKAELDAWFQQAALSEAAAYQGADKDTLYPTSFDATEMATRALANREIADKEVAADRLFATEQAILGGEPEVRRAYLLAQQIAEGKEINPGTGEPNKHESITRAQEERLTGLLEDAEKSGFLEKGADTFNKDNDNKLDIHGTTPSEYTILGKVSRVELESPLTEEDLVRFITNAANTVSEPEPTPELAPTPPPEPVLVPEPEPRREPAPAPRLSPWLGSSMDEARARAAESIAIHESEVEAVVAKYAKKLAARSKSMGLFERGRTKEQMAGAREEIADYIGALATEMMDKYTALGMPDNEWVEKIDRFIQESMEKVVGGMETARADEFHHKNKVVQFGLEKWASWATPEVERQDGESRIRHLGRSALAGLKNVNTYKKSGIFAALGLGVGAVVTPFVGLVGGGALIVAGATLLSRQIARGLVGAKLDSVSGSETIAQRQAAEMTAKMNSLADATHYELLELAEITAEGYRKHNRNRLIGGIAISLAVGGGTGALIHQFVDFNLLFGKTGEVLKSVFNKTSSGAHGPNGGPVVQPGGGGSPSATSSPSPESSPTPPVLPSPESSPTPPVLPSPESSVGSGPVNESEAAVQDYINQHSEALNISNGEGWYETFKELGVKPEDYHKLLQEVGDDLHKQGIAYRDKAHGEWRMNMTPNHTMPEGALKTIVEQAQADGYLKNPLNFGAEVAQTGQVSGVDHGVSLWHGAPTESVLQETYGTYGGTLTNSQAFEAINAMYSNPDIGSHGVFDGATLSTPSSGDIWIDQDHGSVSLTPKAKEFLDTFMASQPKVGENLASVETLAISDFHPETMDQLLDKLNAAHVVDVPKAQYGQAAKQMGSLLFRNDLAFYDRHSHTWELNTVNWSKRNVVDAVAYLRNHFTRAA